MPQSVRLGVACHRHSPDDLLRCHLQQLKAHLVVECTHLGVFGRHVWPVGRSHGLRLDRSCRPSFRRCPSKARRRQCTQLESACADDDSADQDSASDSARHGRQRAAHAAKADADRRPLDRVPGLLRASGRELLHPDRPAHQRRLRLHLHVDQRATRREADPSRRCLRRIASYLPLRDLQRIQGKPHDNARRIQRPARPGQGGAQGSQHPLRGKGRVSRPTM